MQFLFCCKRLVFKQHHFNFHFILKTWGASYSKAGTGDFSTENGSEAKWWALMLLSICESSDMSVLPFL